MTKTLIDVQHLQSGAIFLITRLNVKGFGILLMQSLIVVMCYWQRK